MEVSFVRENGECFTMKVNIFGTFMDVKKKIQELYNIPISNQLLYFNNKLLDDHEFVMCNDIHFQSSRIIHINLVPDDSTIKLHVKLYKTDLNRYSLEINLNDTVLHLKQKIHNQIFNCIPVNAMSLIYTTSESDFIVLNDDNQPLRQHRISNGSIIHVKQALTSVLPPSISNSEKLPRSIPAKRISNSEKLMNVKVPRILNSDKLMNVKVQGNSNSKKLISVKVAPMENRGGKFMVKGIDSSDEVKCLRKKLVSHYSDALPKDGGRFFFIHKQSVMYEDKSFEYNGVNDGDTIELFDGYVVGTVD